MATVLYTHNLALGVLVGILLSCVFFAREIARSLTITSQLDKGAKHRTYLIHGQLFFVSTEIFRQAFNTSEAVNSVIIDLTTPIYGMPQPLPRLTRLCFALRRIRFPLPLWG